MATPALSLSPDVVKRLTYSKFLLQRANTLQREGNEFAAAEAVMTLQDAVEMLMRVVTDILNLSGPDNFMSFWNNVKTATGTEPGHKQTMDRLNNLRVGFKHKGNLPNPKVVSDIFPIATSFFHEISAIYLKIDFENVSLADLILNAEARNAIKESETEFANGNKARAFELFVLAYEALRTDAENKFGLAVDQGAFDRHDRTISIPSELRPYTRGLGIENIGKSLQKVIDVTNLLVMEIEPRRDRRFNKMIPNPAGRTATGEVRFEWSRDPNNLTNEDYDFCRSFLIDLGLRLMAD